MLCILEIAMTIMGIVLLFKGRFTFGSKEVRGAPAYLIGVLLTLTFPLILGTGVIIGVMAAANGQQLNPAKDLWLILIDLGGVALIAIPCLIIAFASAQEPERSTFPYPPGGYSPGGFTPPPPGPPMDPKNPYAPPNVPPNPFGDYPPKT